MTSAGAVTLVPDVDPPQGPRVILVEPLRLNPSEPGRLRSVAGRRDEGQGKLVTCGGGIEEEYECRAESEIVKCGSVSSVTVWKC